MSIVKESNEHEGKIVSFKNQNNSNNSNEIDLVSSEQRIVNNLDTSLAIDNNKSQSIFNKNFNKTSDNSIDKKLDLIYGVPYENKYPKKIGNLRVFLYIKNIPIIVIGPNCKYFSYIFLI